MKQIDHNPNEKRPFFGANAKPFFIQMAFVIFCVVVLAKPARYWIGEALCSGIDFCSTEQQQRQIELSGQ